MFIIFDLDDTLIDTSGAITPVRLRSVTEDERAYQELLAINKTCGSSAQALQMFAEQRSLGRDWLAWAAEQMSRPLPDEMEIPLTTGAKEILEWLATSSHTVALVTGGSNPSFQMEKLEKSRIDSSLFQSIVIAEDSKKKPYYEALANGFGGSPREILVCGDRPSMDLQPAYELGFRTYLRRWGRGLQVKREPWMEGEVWNLAELKESMV